MEEVVPEYTSKNEHVRQLFHDRLAMAILFLKPISSKTRILDIGCGDGIFETKIMNLLSTLGLFPKIIAVDINPINTNPSITKNCEFIQCDFCSMKRKWEKFDIIVALDVLEHMDDVDFELALKNIKRFLKPSGQVIVSGPTESVLYKLGRFVTEWHWNSEFNNQDIHYRSIYKIEEALKSIGLRQTRVSNLPMWPFTLFRVSEFVLRKS